MLHGNPDQTRDLIDASPKKWSYTAGVISFAESDEPRPDAQQEAIELFEALAFAGLDRDQYDCLWDRHTHERNVELHDWILDQISVGIITDRASMLDAFTDAGFDIPRAGKAYLTAQDPDTGERWRLKGRIFHQDWQAEPPRREIERGPGNDPERPRRLEGISAGELQERFRQHCNQRAAHNRNRYQVHHWHRRAESFRHLLKNEGLYEGFHCTPPNRHTHVPNCRTG